MSVTLCFAGARQVQNPELLSRVQIAQAVGRCGQVLCDSSYPSRDEMLAEAEARGECYFMAAGRIDGAMHGR